ncbi:ribosome recycling factor [bacterium]|nr:ribosome recycling factor [bacterium]
MIDELLKDVEERMSKSHTATQMEFTRIRAGRANAAILDGIRVDYYGTPTPLNQVAGLATPEPRLITISPWEKPLVQEIVKAIQSSDLGLNPASDGNIIRIPIPPLTEETRKDLVKRVKVLAEDGKVAIRNIRRGGIEDAKKAQKGKDITEDDLKLVSDKIQKLTDRFVEEVDKSLDAKVQEIMEV